MDDLAVVNTYIRTYVCMYACNSVVVCDPHPYVCM